MTVIKHRRDSTRDWERANPILYEGEIGYDTDLKTFKMGDGSTPWLGLPYFQSDNSLNVDQEFVAEAIHDHVVSTSPHPVYDDIPSLVLLYQNAKV